MLHCRWQAGALGTACGDADRETATRCFVRWPV